MMAKLQDLTMTVKDKEPRFLSQRAGSGCGGGGDGVPPVCKSPRGTHG
jgi:hypothetical protein